MRMLFLSVFDQTRMSDRYTCQRHGDYQLTVGLMVLLDVNHTSLNRSYFGAHSSTQRNAWQGSRNLLATC